MSWRGTPKDNPIIEALNGWMKEELYLDFGLTAIEDVLLLLNKHVHFFNSSRPAAALGYKSQFSTRPSWAFNYGGFRAYFLLTDAA